MMKDRGLLWICLIVAGAFYLLGSPNENVPKSISPKVIDPQVDPAKQALPQSLGGDIETSDIQTLAGTSNTSTPMFVGANKLNVRVAPGAGQKSVGLLQRGAEVTVLEVREGWARIRSRDGLKGWVSGNFLQRRRPEIETASPSAPQSNAVQTLSIPKKKTINRENIVQEIIAFSIQTYSGRCPCPYNVMRNGRRCGGNSAYSRPGGRSPICYPEDGSDQMIEAWAAKQ